MSFRRRSAEPISDRPQLRHLLSSLEAGDLLVVTRLDRLARSTSDLLNIIQATASKRATFLSLAEPWANTSTAVGKLMLTVLGGIAEFERDLIALRTNEGRARARRSGNKIWPKVQTQSPSNG